MVFLPRALEMMDTGDLDLWYYRIPPGQSSLMAGSDTWLNAAERARAGRLVARRARDRYCISHQFLRWVLASYLDCSEQELGIRRDGRGKPVLMAPHGRLHFNLSYAGDAVAVAAACAREVGVDIAWVRQLPAAPVSTLFGLAAAFDAEEAAALRALPPLAARCEVTRLWTLKEALAKATGAGLALPLRGAAFPVRGPAGAACSAPRFPGTWSFHCLPLADGGWLSAAIAGHNGRTRVLTLTAPLTRSAQDSIGGIDAVARSVDGMPLAPGGQLEADPAERGQSDTSPGEGISLWPRRPSRVRPAPRRRRSTPRSVAD